MSEVFEPQTEAIRLHPSSPLFIFFEAVKKLIVPLVASYYLGGSHYSGEWIFYGIAALASIGTRAQDWLYHYWREEDRIVVKSGIVCKSLRQVPYERIQNVNIEKNPLHHFFKVATLQIESASGSKPEAIIRVINGQQVADIQQAIKQASGGHSDTVNVSDDQTDGEPINTSIGTDTADVEIDSASSPKLLKLSAGDITRYGSIHWQALVPLAAIFGFAMQNDKLQHQFANFLLGLVMQVKTLTMIESKVINYFVFGIISVIVIWLVSILMAHLKFHGFTLREDNKKLHAEMGLLTRITANIPIKRIQLLRIKSSFLNRLIKRHSISMETAGGVTEQTGIVMRWIAPVIEPEKVNQLVQTIEPHIELDQLKWRHISDRAWLRLLKKITALFSVLIAILSVAWTKHAAWALLSFPLWLWYAKAWANKAQFAHNDHLIAFRSGVLYHTISVVKINKVQTIHLAESPFDRRNKHGQLWLDTAGSNITLHHIKIPYLEKPDLLELHQKLNKQVSQSQFVW